MASGARKLKRTAADGERPAALRNLPSVEACLGAAERDAALAPLSHEYLKTLMRRVLRELRGEPEALAAALATGEPPVEEILRRVRLAVAAEDEPLQSVVNATGVVIHTNLGRALLAESAIAAMVRAARAPVNLEYDLARGERGDRDDVVQKALCALTGAEAATVVNNNAAALLLVLNTLADGREVIVSRGELIEIGGSFRLPELMARSGARLREVGATNRTHAADYVAAIGPATALLMKVHPSNYQITGYTAVVELAELAAIARAHELEVVEDLGAGALIDLGALGLPREPLVRERIAAGAALVTFSGDKLLGGPQAGIIVGRRQLIERLKHNPLWRALRCDKLRLAALAATLQLYQRSRTHTAELPTLRMLLRTPAELTAVAARAREILIERLGPPFAIAIVASAAQIGSGSQPVARLESCALRVTHPHLSANAIAAAFRRAKVIGRVHDDAFLLDLRAIEDPALLAVTPSFD
ncbi:MAG TPA: L-seryl-tRNA(Sec) selenium transferase [Candidatus Binataceae bacterium]|nr:L-seryl-tRNA(Sec) selenium transferase [Candidatus Binataceae bacterium]